MSDIAQAMKAHPVNFSASINGNPTIRTLNKIANILEVDISELFIYSQTAKEVTGYLEVNGEIIKISSRSDILKVLDMLDK